MSDAGLNLPDLGIDWGKQRDELHADLGDVFGKVNRTAVNGLSRITQSAGQTPDGLGRIAAAGYGGDNTLGRIAGYGNYGGGLGGLDFFSTLPPSDPFANFTRAQAASQAAAAAQPATTPTSSAASGGGYGAHEQYRALIEQYAAQQGIDPDALAAILQIETPNGDPHAVSGAGARGLGQIMPSTWAGLADPGDDPFDPAASIKNAAKYYAGLYRQFGDYGLAAAAYQGGPGAIVNGRARSDVNDGNMTPAQYAAAWQANYQRIKSSPRPAAVPGAAVDPSGYSFPIVGFQGDIQLHHGTEQGASDLFAPEGTAVVAMRGGKVIDAGWNDLGGWSISIQGDDGLTYYYAHLMVAPAVRTGQTIGTGVFIGQVGDTGNAKGTGAHLHLGIGYGIQTGDGPQGGAGIGYNAVGLLQQVYQNHYARR